MNNSVTRILVVDDEPDIRELVTLTLERMGLTVQSAPSLSEAHTLLEQSDYHLCFTDMKLPDGDGLDLVAHIQQAHPDMPVAVITAHGTMDTAVRALKSGAFDFVAKPIDLQQLRNLVNVALNLNPQLVSQNRRSRNTLLGDSPVIRDIRHKISKLARNQAPIHISGESGTGKELAARLIHSQGPRSERPFVAVNCGAIPPELMESEFFGHKKGSFTGAVSDKTGLFQAAEGGTLFLDEVAELPLPLQVKLLRAIQEKAVRPVGEQKEFAVDVRILSASHKNLDRLVQQGLFRQDLFYRINVIQLQVPPLRERPGDIAILASHILERLAAANNGQAYGLSPQAASALCAHLFPGNVRELENVLERAVALCDGETIQAEDLGLPLATAIDAPPPLTGGTATAAHHLPNIAEGANLDSLDNYKDELERQTILQALEKTRWNRTAAAKQLGITFRALRYRLKKLGLE